jgi:hypothetical protein
MLAAPRTTLLTTRCGGGIGCLAIGFDRNHISVDPLSWLASEFPRRRKASGDEAYSISPNTSGFGSKGPDFLLGFRKELHMTVEETRRRAETMFKKEQRLREAELAMAEYQAEVRATREKTARLRAQRLARDSANQKTPRAKQKGAA